MEINDTNSGIETVWGNYPIFIGAIADGKVYAFTNEHSPNYPLYKGEQVYVIDATNGHEVYKLLGWSIRWSRNLNYGPRRRRRMLLQLLR